MEYNPRNIRQTGHNRILLAGFARALTGSDYVLELLNVYKGIPVTYQAWVQHVRDDSLVLRTHRISALCLKLDGFTYIQTNLIEQVVKANVVHVDVTRSIATLNNFVPADPSIGKRESVRVDVDSQYAIPVTIFSKYFIGSFGFDALKTRAQQRPGDPAVSSRAYKDIKLIGKLADISLGGIGIEVLTTNVMISDHFTPNTEVDLHLRFPNQAQSPTPAALLPGRIRYVEQAHQQKFKIGVSIEPDEATTHLIRDLIARRATEILAELESQSSLSTPSAGSGN